VSETRLSAFGEGLPVANHLIRCLGSVQDQHHPGREETALQAEDSDLAGNLPIKVTLMISPDDIPQQCGIGHLAAGSQAQTLTQNAWIPLP
jgi:hypothetical protein